MEAAALGYPYPYPYPYPYHLGAALLGGGLAHPFAFLGAPD